MKILFTTADMPEPTEVMLRRADAAHAANFLADVLGQTLDVSIERQTAHAGQLTHRGRVIPYRVLIDGETIAVWMDGRVHRFERVSRTAQRAEGGGAAGHAGELTAPMPGKVLRVDVEAGHVFAAHDPLIIMESMKMEMTLSAPGAGRVREILCQAGDLVEMGARLAVLEPLDDAGDAEAETGT